MLKGQITVTKENLLQWIENYRWMVKNNRGSKVTSSEGK